MLINVPGSFNPQTLERPQAGDVGPAFGYATGSVMPCINATYRGWLLGRP